MKLIKTMSHFIDGEIRGRWREYFEKINVTDDEDHVEGENYLLGEQKQV